MDSSEQTSENYEFYRINQLFHLALEDRILISKLIQESYRDGMLNGLSLKKENNNNTNQNKNV